MLRIFWKSNDMYLIHHSRPFEKWNCWWSWSRIRLINTSIVPQPRLNLKNKSDINVNSSTSEMSETTLGHFWKWNIPPYFSCKCYLSFEYSPIWVLKFVRIYPASSCIVYIVLFRADNGRQYMARWFRRKPLKCKMITIR